MSDKDAPSSHWLLALESSTAHGGSALLLDGRPHGTFLLEEGLRHGRELTASANTLMEAQSLKAADLLGVAVSAGPGSYTGIRVGAMAAKALAWGAGIKLAAVSSLAALAQTLVLDGAALEGDRIYTVQDARRDEVYCGVFRIDNGLAIVEREDAAVTPEEAAEIMSTLEKAADRPIRLAGSSFTTYATVLGEREARPGRVDPAAVGQLGWRQILLEKTADPMNFQPTYLRRDSDADWRHDHLISRNG
jgi:universal bacterial protein YeaZ